MARCTSAKADVSPVEKFWLIIQLTKANLVAKFKDLVCPAIFTLRKFPSRSVEPTKPSAIHLGTS
jgi:hypothetical protein